MSLVLIFAVGVFVSGVALTAVVLVGLGEASDSALSRDKDLTEIERKIVGR